MSTRLPVGVEAMEDRQRYSERDRERHRERERETIKRRERKKLSERERGRKRHLTIIISNLKCS